MNAHAQMGSFINLWGGPQQSKFANTDDIYNAGFNPEDTTALSILPTYRSAYGLEYIYNFDSTFGLYTGLTYAFQGQEYHGVVDSLTDTGKVVYFNSGVYNRYIKVPLMFRFNVPMDNYAVCNLSMGVGFYTGYLQRVDSVICDPVFSNVPSKYDDFNWTSMYHRLDIGLAAMGQVNVKLSKKLFLDLGMSFSRGFLNIDKRDYPWEDDMSDVFYYPLSVPKYSQPSRKDYTKSARYPTINTTYNIYMGVMYRLSSLKK